MYALRLEYDDAFTTLSLNQWSCSEFKAVVNSDLNDTVFLDDMLLF